MAELDLRSDLVIIFKEGADCELQIKNASRGLVGGALINIGDGLVAFQAIATNWDQVLANGGSFAADRTADLATHKLIFSAGQVVFAASTTARPNLNLPVGVAPTSPVTGDFYHTSGHLFFRDGSTTYDLLTPPGGNLDATLALGGSFTADRSSNMTNAFKWTIDNPQFVFTNVYSQVSPQPLFTASPKSTVAGWVPFRFFTNSANNLMPYDAIISETPNGPPDDNVFIQGWNSDQLYSSSDPSQTIRMEYKYLGGNYEYHYQWQELSSSRLYRLFSSTFQNFGTTATDQNLWYFEATQFDIRSLAGTAYITAHAGAGNHTFTIQSLDASNGIIIGGSAASNNVDISPSVVGNTLYFHGWPTICFGNACQLQFQQAHPTGLHGLNDIYDVDHVYLTSNGGAATYALFTTSFVWAIQLVDATGSADYFSNGSRHNFQDTGSASLFVIGPSVITAFKPLITVASVVGAAGLNIPSGTAPTSPVNGDTYQDGTHAYMRIGGAWKQLDN